MGLATDRPLTPDFYEYAWDALDSARLDGRFVELSWPDGRRLRVYDLWLLENEVGRGIDLATRESVVDPATLPPDAVFSAAGVDADGALTCAAADDGRHCRFHPGWLRHVADGHHLPSAAAAGARPWTTADLDEPPTHDARRVLADGNTSALGAWLDDLLVTGLARLSGCPPDPDFVLEVAGRLGAVRDTNFGRVWDVRADIANDGTPDRNSTANTTYRLAPHTDLPSRETPPGFQFLHCIVNDVDGGWSTMADGLAVVEHVRTEHPDAYDALTTLRWVFANRGRGIDHRWSGPIIDLGVAGSPLTLRAFWPVRAFPDMDDADVPRAYDALRTFARVAASDRFQLRYPFRPGDLVAFDNRRILHGRDAFAGGGSRHLRGLYIDRDEVLSAARVLGRASGRAHR